jgi:carboxyl-terminal processing protease
MSDFELLPPTDPGLPATHGAEVERGRPATFWLALVLVAVFAGAAMFVSGFSLGRLSEQTPGTSEARQELFRPFWDAYNDIVKSYISGVDEHALIEGAIDGLFSTLNDPYSFYMTEEEYQQSLQGLSGRFEGIGAQMTTQEPEGTACETISATCRLVITHVLRNTPALRAGLLEGDVVLAVDGKTTIGSGLEATVLLIRGPENTSVVLTIERDGVPQEFSIKRAVIEREDVTSMVIADGRIGYLDVAGFSIAAAADLHDQLGALINDEGVRGVILDLRDDPGGYVDQAQKIASEFIGSGTLYFEQSAGAEPAPKSAAAGGVATDPSIRVVVLVNKGTASASEIVAAALQGNGRAVLVGQTTFGKGTVQEFKELAGAGGYRLSVRKWLTPDQTWIHGVGLTPDVEVTPSTEPEPGSDPELDRAVELLLAPTFLAP